MDERDLTELLRHMPDDELARTLQDVRVGLSMLSPVSGMYRPAKVYLTALSAELAKRNGEGT